MKILKYSCLCIVVASALSLPAKAQTESNSLIKPYIGTEIIITRLSYNDEFDLVENPGGVHDELDELNEAIEEELDGGGKVDLPIPSVYVGLRVNNSLGFEFGYSGLKGTTDVDVTYKDIGNSDVTTKVNTTVEFRSLSLDIMGYLPLDKEENVELIGSLGAIRTSGTVEVDKFTNLLGTNKLIDQSEINPRFGVGAQFKIFGSNARMRTMLRSQKSDFDGLLNRTVSLSVGLNYTF